MINQIKEDLNNGHTSLEYMEIIDGYDWTFMIEDDCILYYWFDIGYMFSGRISIDRFQELTDKEIQTYINSDMYYNTIME